MTPKLSKNKVLRGLVIVVISALPCVQGCKKKEQRQVPAPVPKPVVAANVKQPEKIVQKQVSSSSKLAPAPVNQFDFSTKKDPFKPYVILKKPPVSARIRRSRKIDTFALPIHSFDVSQFKLIGIISGGKESRAMITDPNGKGYVIKVGMTIGKNEGRVMSITSGGVDVLEQFTDDNGKTRKEHIRINLPRK